MVTRATFWLGIFRQGGQFCVANPEPNQSTPIFPIHAVWCLHPYIITIIEQITLSTGCYNCAKLLHRYTSSEVLNVLRRSKLEPFRFEFLSLDTDLPSKRYGNISPITIAANKFRTVSLEMGIRWKCRDTLNGSKEFR